MKEASSHPTIAAVCGLVLTALAGTATCLATDATPNDSQPALQEIVVTANKRTENVQDVAAGVSVESGAQLVERNLTSLADYAANVPGFNVVSQGTPGQTSVSIRGISSNTATSAVGSYIDDTPIGSSSGWAIGANTLLDMLPYDVDRIEVLRGPQGTLYGEGAMGGLIKYVLKTPSTAELQTNLGADVSTIDGAGGAGYSLRARVNVPISDVLAVTASVFGHQTPGYMYNAFTGARDTNEDRQYGGRVAALWLPVSNLSVKLTALTSTIEADDSAFRQSAGTVSVPNASGALLVAPTNFLPYRTESVAFPSAYDQHLYYAAATIDWNPGSFDVVSATSWSKQNSLILGDVTPQYGSILPFLGGTSPGLADVYNSFGLDKVTEELRLVSPKGGAIEWLAGLFATHERSNNTYYNQAFTLNYQPYSAFPFPPGLFYSSFPETFNEYAAFGNLTWNASDAFSITGGARYAYNDQRILFYTPPAPFWPPPNPEYVGTATHQGVPTWLTTAQYRFNTDVMAYARVATGYRPGGPNSPIPGIPVTYKSDSLINYELGLKSMFLERKVLIDFAAYRIDWKDIQLTAVNSSDLGYEANGGKALSQGIELTSQYSPIRSLTLALNAAYTNAHLTSLIPQTTYLLIGHQLPQVPKESVSATIDYEFPVASRWTTRVGGAYRYVGPQYAGLEETASAVSTPTFQVPGYSVFDLNASVRKDGLTLRLFARNLGNNQALVGGGNVITNSATGASHILATFLQPRTIGVGVDYGF